MYWNCVTGCIKTTHINTPVKLVLSLVCIWTGESFSVLGMRSGVCCASRDEMVCPCEVPLWPDMCNGDRGAMAGEDQGGLWEIWDPPWLLLFGCNGEEEKMHSYHPRYEELSGWHHVFGYSLFMLYTLHVQYSKESYFFECTWLFSISYKKKLKNSQFCNIYTLT